MAYNMKRSSGLDFSDRGSGLEAHPDLTLNVGSTHLQRNKTERQRMQGLMRIPTMRGLGTTQPTDATNLSLKERWDLWMVNEGGRRIFFMLFLLLHIFVFTFGWLHYANKDNLVTARSLFAGTFGEWLLLNRYRVISF